MSQLVITEHFVKGSDNVITLDLYEGEAKLSGAWSQLDIYIGDPALVTITRNADGVNGVNFLDGRLQINPSKLSETLTPLIAGTTYPVVIRVRDLLTHTTGAYFGAKDSRRGLLFEVSDPPG